MRNRPTLFSLLITVAFLFGSGVYGQKYSLQDSINVRDKDKMRQWSYENNLTNYPAKKRNNWALGFKGGMSSVSGDIRPTSGAAFSMNLRKALGHVLSLRLEGTYGWAKGQNWRRSGQGTIYQNRNLTQVNSNDTTNPMVNYGNAHPITTDPDYSAAIPEVLENAQLIYHNFRTSYWDVDLQAVININNINFYRKTPRWSIIGFGGIGVMGYHTKMDQLDINGNMYDYHDIYVAGTQVESGIITDVQLASQDREDRKDILNALDNMMDGDYESEAQYHTHKTRSGNTTIIPVAALGAGISYRLSRRVSLSLEHKTTITFDDLLDGQRYQETGAVSSNFDYLQYTSLGINFRIGKGEDALWWTNPLDQPLDRVRNMDLEMDKASKDTDGDGVFDSVDEEKQTPKGAPVDVKGRALDSDGDGVHDFRDNDPFTPKGAQVDNKGNALDSDKDGVIDLFDIEPNTEAGAQVDAKGKKISVSDGGDGDGANINQILPIINFDFGKTNVRQSDYAELYSVAKIMKDNPNIKIRVVGHTDNRNTPEFNQKLGMERAENAVNFLNKNFGIDKSRFVVESRGATEPVINELPNKRNTKQEDLHGVNRRVEFSVAK